MSSLPTGSINSHLGMTKPIEFFSPQVTLGQRTYPAGMEQTRKVMQKEQREDNTACGGATEERLRARQAAFCFHSPVGVGGREWEAYN